MTLKKQILDMEGYSPLYQQLVQKLRNEIASGVYPVHSRFPSEQELCRTYDVSRVTVRKALAELSREGLLKRQQGKGTFVDFPIIRRDLAGVCSFSDACRLTGCIPSARVLSHELVDAEAEDLHTLLLQPGVSLVRIIRLRLADNLPVMVEENRFGDQFGWLLEEDLNQPLYSLLRKRGVRPGQATHDISLCYADASLAELLEVEEGSALLRLHEVIFDQSGKPLHISDQSIRGDRFTFRI